MFDAEKLLGQMLMHGVSGSGRKRKGKRRRVSRGLGGSVRQAAFSPQGLTLLGGIAFAAFEHLKEKRGAAASPPPRGMEVGETAPSRPAGDLPPLPPRPSNLPPLPVPPPRPVDSPGGPVSGAPAANERARLLVEAMVSAAKADGRVDAKERARILAHLDQSGATPQERREFETMLEGPPDLDGLADRAIEAGVASEVYLASALVTDPDDAVEQGYLAMLAARLRLPDDLIAQLHLEAASSSEDVDDDEPPHGADPRDDAAGTDR